MFSVEEDEHPLEQTNKRNYVYVHNLFYKRTQKIDFILLGNKVCWGVNIVTKFLWVLVILTIANIIYSINLKLEL